MRPTHVYCLVLLVLGAASLAALVFRSFPFPFSPRPLLTKTKQVSAKVRTSQEDVAVFATLVATSDHDRWWPPMLRALPRTEDLVKSAVSLRCSGILRGSMIPFHLIYGGGLQDRDLRILQKFGWILEYYNDSASRTVMQQAYKPVYYDNDAHKSSQWWDWWVPNNGVQGRRNGWAYYFKFFAWRFTKYRKILHMDLDTCLEAAPDKYIQLFPRNISFAATYEIAGRMYGGLDTHAMFLSPSEQTFQTLLVRAKSGEYVPYANTEQDVLETMFPPPTADRVTFPLQVGGVELGRYPPRRHKKNIRFQTCTLSEVETCQEFLEQCWRWSRVCKSCRMSNLGCTVILLMCFYAGVSLD